MRRTKDVTITDDGRDKGKTFRLTEMSAMRAEEWAARALLAVTKAGVDIGPDVQNAGMAGIAVRGLQSLNKLEWVDLKPLMDEMFECVTVADANNAGFTRKLTEDDIEEVKTRLLLRSEVFTLHTGFSLTEAASQKKSTSDHRKSNSSTIRTSQRR